MVFVEGDGALVYIWLLIVSSLVLSEHHALFILIVVFIGLSCFSNIENKNLLKSRFGIIRKRINKTNVGYTFINNVGAIYYFSRNTNQSNTIIVF